MRSRFRIRLKLQLNPCPRRLHPNKGMTKSLQASCRSNRLAAAVPGAGRRRDCAGRDRRGAGRRADLDRGLASRPARRAAPFASAASRSRPPSGAPGLQGQPAPGNPGFVGRGPGHRGGRFPRRHSGPGSSARRTGRRRDRRAAERRTSSPSPPPAWRRRATSRPSAARASAAAGEAVRTPGEGARSELAFCQARRLEGPARGGRQGAPLSVGRTERQRIDRWLWHARVVRTRGSAAALADAGYVRVNGVRVDGPGRMVRTGDVVTVALDGGVRVLKVIGFAKRRGPAGTAAALYLAID